MLQNIIDRRRRPYRWRQVDVIAEPTWHDNACPDADPAEQIDQDPGYASRKGISLSEAVEWAIAMPVPMTLYLHDAGSKWVEIEVPWPEIAA